MAHPYFSIVIPALHEERALPKLLKDLRSQTYTDFDVWVVDGQSEDKTFAIIDQLGKKDARFHGVISTRRNVGYQRNLGAKKSSGKYVLFFDADNRIPPYYLAGLHYQCAKQNVDAFTTYATPDSTNAKELIFLNFTNMVIEHGARIGLPFAFGACIGCRRDAFGDVQGFDDTMTFGEDTDFTRRLVRTGFEFSVFKDPMYTFSMRRYRKEGTLKVARQYAPLGIKLLINKKSTTPLDSYPMLGGKYFENTPEKERSTQTFKQLQALMKTLREIVTS